MRPFEILREDFPHKQADLMTNKDNSKISRMARMELLIVRPVKSLRHYLNKFIKMQLWAHPLSR
jgi:hypothetical protein